MTAKITIGPLLFHWPAEKRRDFYYQIADNPHVDTVYLGEVICSKRTPFFIADIDAARQRLEDAGKTVVFSTLSEVTERRDQKDIEKICKIQNNCIEVNDASALWRMDGRAHYIGQLLNVYNEQTMAHLHAKGAVHFCVPSELPSDALTVLGNKAKELDVALEVQVFGRTSLALSARCYHARAHNRIKANCRFVCGEDHDGMDLTTLSGDTFLTVNGIQTLSYHYLSLIGELKDLQKMGVSHFRLSPHTTDMDVVIQAFHDVLFDKASVTEARDRLEGLDIEAPFVNGFFHGQPGLDYVL